MRLLSYSSSPAILEQTTILRETQPLESRRRDRTATAFDYDNYVLSLEADERISGSSTSIISQRGQARESSLKTDYRLSFTSTLPHQANYIRQYSMHSHTSSVESERKKKIISRIVTVVAIVIFIVCILVVTLTLRLSHKIDELVRLKQLMPKPIQQYPIDGIVSTALTTITTTTRAAAATSSLSRTSSSKPSSIVTSLIKRSRKNKAINYLQTEQLYSQSS
ncbi:unnamed protein product [Didymodactylos carnosus]|uniref:Uncharacterized protein n=1 Tax=Didymodactylos carnosus TaxID=1234261 RepID=A0A814INC7_9BILA|nr:unnamed protein product [Didymodactylos carnosus]CAF1228943.1 unnamed protein product [Didymodactylos carnosus]CAF3796256.1 unnamed protein product [Didymodactylos carnosus]CAF4036891.1 unnamed protein product [Didymodactylos carnosus]